MATKGVLALTKDGRLTRCTASPDKRGFGRCNHVAHMEEGQSEAEFLAKSINPNEGKTYEEIKQDFINENKIDFNHEINWSEVINEELVLRYINWPETPNLHCKTLTERTTNEYGDIVDQITLQFENEGEIYNCDFGQVPVVAEDGTISINGVRWVCLPVVDRNKVGYGQMYDKEGRRTVWLLQKDGNLGITIPEGSKTWRILGKEYDADYIRQCVINGYSDDPKVDSIIRSLDTDIIKERFPEFATEDFDKKMFEAFKKDEVNDLSYRRVHTFKDQVKDELEAQLRRMGVTYRSNIKKGNGLVFYQQNNTKNIIDNLVGRSNVQLADDTNPIALFSQTHKISLVGREGYNKDVCPAELRDVHDSMRGISDPLDQSSGKGIGLTLFMSNAATSRGFIEPNGNTDALSTSDFVPFKYHNNPNRVSMACSQLRQAVRIEGGEDPYLLNDPSDQAWKQISGSKIGVNLRTVFLTSDVSWEDSCGISESAAKKLAHRKSYKFPYDYKYRNKIGSEVKIGEKIGGITVKNPGILREENGNMYVDSLVEFRTGSKIAGRIGNKGTAIIIPDDKMPKVWDTFTQSYKPAEVIMSPLSTGKRSNIGIIKETNQTMDGTKPVKLADGKTVEGVNYGYQYTMRLNQMAEEKETYHGFELDGKGEIIGNRQGEMENIVLSTTEARRDIIKQFKANNPNKDVLRDFMKGIGVQYKEIN